MCCAAYFLFFEELAHGESDARFAILSSFQSNEQRISRLITLDLQMTWGAAANQIRFKAASPDTFVYRDHVQEIRSDYVPSVLKKTANHN